MNSYHQVNLFVKIEQTANLDILLRDVSLLDMTYLSASLRTYSFDCSQDNLFVTFRLSVNAKDMSFCITGNHKRWPSGSK